MPIVRVTHTARTEVREIRRYIREDSKEAAKKLVAKFNSTFAMLATHPLSGRMRDELLANMRSFPVGSYVIFYDVIPDGVEIIHVIHGSRDLRAIFKS